MRFQITLDQAIALFLISDFLTPVFFKIWQEISLARIERELDYSFTSDGVLCREFSVLSSWHDYEHSSFTEQSSQN